MYTGCESCAIWRDGNKSSDSQIQVIINAFLCVLAALSGRLRLHHPLIKFSSSKFPLIYCTKTFPLCLINNVNLSARFAGSKDFRWYPGDGLASFFAIIDIGMFRSRHEGTLKKTNFRENLCVIIKKFSPWHARTSARLRLFFH